MDWQLSDNVQAYNGKMNLCIEPECTAQETSKHFAGCLPNTPLNLKGAGSSELQILSRDVTHVHTGGLASSLASVYKLNNCNAHVHIL